MRGAVKRPAAMLNALRRQMRVFRMSRHNNNNKKKNQKKRNNALFWARARAYAEIFRKERRVYVGFFLPPRKESGVFGANPARQAFCNLLLAIAGTLPRQIKQMLFRPSICSLCIQTK